jgi:hypothetical protein
LFDLKKFHSSTDRNARYKLLSNIELFVEHLADKVVNEQVYPQIENGFIDREPVIREKTWHPASTSPTWLELVFLFCFLLPSLPKISCPIEGRASRTDVAFDFMPGAEQWYRYQCWLLWHTFKLTKLFDRLA